MSGTRIGVAMREKSVFIGTNSAFGILGARVTEGVPINSPLSHIPAAYSERRYKNKVMVRLKRLASSAMRFVVLCRVLAMAITAALMHVRASADTIRCAHARFCARAHARAYWLAGLLRLVSLLQSYFPPDAPGQSVVLKNAHEQSASLPRCPEGCCRVRSECQARQDGSIRELALGAVSHD